MHFPFMNNRSNSNYLQFLNFYLKKWCLLVSTSNTKVFKCGHTCVVCDQPKSARTHAHRTHISKVFSHALAHVRPHIAHVRARTHLRNPWLEKLLFGEPTWFYVVHSNLDPTLGVAMGFEVVYPSMWEVKVGSGPR